MLVSTILYNVFRVFSCPNAGILSLVRVTQITQFEKVFFCLCNFNYVKCTCFLGMF